MRSTSLLSALLAASALSATASAQVTVFSSETFEYTFPGLLENAGGGFGWIAPWDVGGNGNEIVIFDQSVNPPMTCADAVGQYAGQASEFIPAIRQPDTSLVPSIVDANGKIGADGAVVWISFRTVQYQVFGDSFGALQLFDTADPSNEQLLLGSPWMSNAWGLDDEGGVGLAPEFIAGTNAADCARLVFRIDHQPGDERIRLWVNPAVDYPTTPADLDTLISDLRWDEIRLNSGGSGTHYFWDDIVLAAGDPGSSIGTRYCSPANVNSSGAPGVMSVAGSNIATDNNITLRASSLPVNSFGFFITSQTQGFVSMPNGSQGNLCVLGSIGRYVGPGQIQNGGVAGSFSLALNLTQTPQPNGFVSVNPGQTWNYQTWHRDSVNGMATSNFTDAVSVMFQ